MHAISAQSFARVQSIRDLIAWPNSPSKEWSGGFLAGIFDAEGSFSQTVLRVKSTDAEIIGWICTCLRAFNFTFVVEHIHHEDKKPIDVVRLAAARLEDPR